MLSAAYLSVGHQEPWIEGLRWHSLTMTSPHEARLHALRLAVRRNPIYHGDHALDTERYRWYRRHHRWQKQRKYAASIGTALDVVSDK